EHSQDDPLMSPAKRGVGVSGADRIAMAAFAVDVRTGMFGDRVVTGQENRALRDEAGQDRRDITTRQGRERPAVAREDAVITAGVSGGEEAQDAEQVGDRASAHGEDRGQCQEDEPTMDRPRECRLEWIEDRTNRLGKLVVNPFQPLPRDTGLARLLTPKATEPLPDLFLGEALDRTDG